MARDAELRMAREADPAPKGVPPLCPRCRSAVDVRRYPAQAEVFMDCWRCKLTWTVVED